jgi:PAS domain S-box-containing protein
MDTDTLKTKSKEELIQLIQDCEKKNTTLNHLYNIFDTYVITSTSDLKGKITAVSDAFCQIAGYSKEELMGKPHNIIRHPDMPKSAFKDLWDTIQSGEIWRGEVKNRKKNGDFYWVDSTIIPLKDIDTGKIYGYKSIRIDITQIKALQETIPDILTEESIMF